MQSNKEGVLLGKFVKAVAALELAEREVILGTLWK